MSIIKRIFKGGRSIGYALLLAYMIAWHNVYYQKTDTRDTIEQVADYQSNHDNSSLLDEPSIFGKS